MARMLFHDALAEAIEPKPDQDPIVRERRRSLLAAEALSSLVRTRFGPLEKAVLSAAVRRWVLDDAEPRGTTIICSMEALKEEAGLSERDVEVALARIGEFISCRTATEESPPDRIMFDLRPMLGHPAVERIAALGGPDLSKVARLR